MFRFQPFVSAFAVGLRNVIMKPFRLPATKKIRAPTCFQGILRLRSSNVNHPLVNKTIFRKPSVLWKVGETLSSPGFLHVMLRTRRSIALLLSVIAIGCSEVVAQRKKQMTEMACLEQTL